MSESVLSTSSVAMVSPMTEHDLLEVVEIEQTTGLSHWGWDAYYRELGSSDRRFMWVWRLDGAAHALAGYVVARLIVDELHINNVAVREAYRRAGIGTALIARVLVEARAQHAVRTVLEVRAGNGPAQALYESYGFKIVGRRRNYYSNPPEDALIMTAEMGGDA